MLTTPIRPSCSSGVSYEGSIHFLVANDSGKVVRLCVIRVLLSARANVSETTSFVLELLWWNWLKNHFLFFSRCYGISTKKMPFFEKLLSAGPRSGGPASSSPANTFSRLLLVWLWMYRIQFLDHFNSKLPLRLRVPWAVLTGLLRFI